MAQIINFNGDSAATTASATSENIATAVSAGATADANGNVASYGTNNPQKAMYGGFTVGTGTTTTDPSFLAKSLDLNVFDPAGPDSRPAGGRSYSGAWVDPYDTTRYVGSEYRYDGSSSGASANGLFKWNHMMMTVAQNFDPFMQKKEMEFPHWWLSRIPRTAYPLHEGTVHETRIYRGGLSIYGGLGMWIDLAGDPSSVDACKPLDYSTYQYAWETMAWSGKRTAWGSDPICIDAMKFIPKAVEQIGWILETGVKFGTDIQNIWNRDMFIYQTVMAGRGYLMTSEYRGAASPRFVYQPFCRFAPTGGAKLSNASGTVYPADVQTTGTDLVANTAYVSKPFIVFDASVELEPLNFDVLDIVRNQLKRRCPEAAVGSIGGERMFALAISSEDVEKYIRGNEEERKYWIEANPNALIQHYGFAPNTFRRWTITEDGDQLRFKIKRYIANYTSGAYNTEAAHYGNVGAAEFTGKPVFIAEMVDPVIAGRAGINGAPVPVPNPDYDTAEIAIAPVFMNRVFTNQFVPDETSLGAGTWFGPKTGLNGKWAWQNIQSKDNPFNKIGNFYGEYQIVPKPDTCVFDCISFLYRRCATPLRSLCPADNVRINPAAANVKAELFKLAIAPGADSGAAVTESSSGKYTLTPASGKTTMPVLLTTKTPVVMAAGDQVTFTKTDGSSGTLTGVVSEALSTTRFEVSLYGLTAGTAVNVNKTGTEVVPA